MGTSVLESEGGECVRIKPRFEEHYRGLLGDRYDSFIKISVRFLRKSVRVNTLKANVTDVKNKLAARGWVSTPIPWSGTGFWVRHKEGRLDIGNTPEHALGDYYVQGAASMLPPEVMALHEGQAVLDMCAAPGSKSTQIAQLLNHTGVVVCNDRTGDRLKPLGLNIQRMGASNALVTRSDGRRFSLLGETFDRVLVDAPCSGTGAIRKSLRTLEMWNPHAVRRLARLQFSLLRAGYACLKTDGILVYSTCTLEPEENEGVVSAFLERQPGAEMMPIKLPIKRSEPIRGFGKTEFHEGVKHCLRIWPQDNDTEGFFVAKIHKRSQNI